MYFLTALACAIASGILWYVFRDRKALHLEILFVTFGAASLMWLIDCIFSAADGEPFVEFGAVDGQIALWTVILGLFFWLIMGFILNNKDKKE